MNWKMAFVLFMKEFKAFELNYHPHLSFWKALSLLFRRAKPYMIS